MQKERINPIIGLDYPDPDVIRVGDTYYMVSTTMHFFPGGEILRSYDLCHWEHMSYIYDRLDSTPAQRLSDGKDIYGKGMWAASLRYHKGMFYVCFVANDTGRTYLYQSKDIEGPWEKGYIDGFYHDCSLLFDDDGRVYIASGNTQISVVELKSDLSGPLEGGLNRVVVSDAGNPQLGYEGTHFYKINGRYYLFLIHSLWDRWKRVQACFMSDSLEGEFIGGDVFHDDIGYCGQGVAQGGIVDTPCGQWYAMLFQDRGAVGRIPVLIPVTWENNYPVFGEKGTLSGAFTVNPTRPKHRYISLVQSDDFRGASPGMQSGQKYDSYGLKSCWQFNHEPDLEYVFHDNEHGIWQLENGRVCKGLTQAVNTITQRMYFPKCSAEITVDGKGLNDGDYAGMCALQEYYAMAAVTKQDGKFFLVMSGVDDVNGKKGKETMYECIALDSAIVQIRLKVDFMDGKDEATFFYLSSTKEANRTWKQIGIQKKLRFTLRHFAGCRFGLFSYATKQTGGKAVFHNFIRDDLECWRQ